MKFDFLYFSICLYVTVVCWWSDSQNKSLMHSRKQTKSMIQMYVCQFEQKTGYSFSFCRCVLYIRFTLLLLLNLLLLLFLVCVQHSKRVLSHRVVRGEQWRRAWPSLSNFLLISILFACILCIWIYLSLLMAHSFSSQQCCFVCNVLLCMLKISQSTLPDLHTFSVHNTLYLSLSQIAVTSNFNLQTKYILLYMYVTHNMKIGNRHDTDEEEEKTVTKNVCCNLYCYVVIAMARKEKECVRSRKRAGEWANSWKNWEKIKREEKKLANIFT